MSASPPRAVLFDAVGTLIHLREPVGATYARLAGGGDAVALQAAFVQALHHKPPMVFPGLDAEATAAAERAWWAELVAAVFGAAGVPLPDAAFAALWDHYATAAAWRADALAHGTLRALRGGGVRTGVVSNFDHRLRAVLDELALTPLLDVVVLPADAGAAKPDPRIFQLALARLGVAAADALYVGDDPRDDAAGAAAAGLGYRPSVAALQVSA